MILIPPLLYSLVAEGKIDPIATKVYRTFKVYKFNSENNLSLGRILSDMELDEKDFRKAFKQLEDYGFITRIRKPGKNSEYIIGEVK